MAQYGIPPYASPPQGCKAFSMIPVGSLGRCSCQRGSVANHFCWPLQDCISKSEDGPQIICGMTDDFQATRIYKHLDEQKEEASRSRWRVIRRDKRADTSVASYVRGYGRFCTRKTQMSPPPQTMVKTATPESMAILIVIAIYA